MGMTATGARSRARIPVVVREIDADRDAAQPTISVVICAFALERLDALEEAISSVRAQTRPAHEIVLAVDHEPWLLAEAQKLWPDVRVIPSREQLGLSGTRNTGLAASRGELVAFLDDDAVAGPKWLERIAAGYEDQRVLAVGGAVRSRWVTGRPSWFPSEFDWVVGCSHSGMPSEPSPVRNLVGANMSFRREVLVGIGGFRHELSRVGKDPVGGDETDVCIRIGKRWPAGIILYDPQVSVDHVVTAQRSRFRYFIARCFGEGGSKATLGRLVGRSEGLRSERAYTRRTIPLGILRNLGEMLRGDVAGAARAAVLATGLAVTTLGYAFGLLRRVKPGATPEPRTEGPLRVLMVTPRSPLGQEGGVQRNVMEVSRRVAAAGAEIEVLCADPGGPRVAEARRDGVLIRSVRAWPAAGDSFLAPGLWREMARQPWDVVHIQSYHTLVAPLAMLRALTLGIPYVVTFHGGGHSQRLRNILRPAHRRALRPLLARAERLVATARFEIDVYGRELGLPRDRFALIPDGADLTEADLADNNAQREPGLLASIGRLERYKGHQRVIAAMPHVLEQRPEARLLIVGTGPYETELREQAAHLGVLDRVEVTSVPNDDRGAMAALLQRVSLMVLLSEFETHPMSVLEAATAGCRIVVADRGGLTELAEEGLARAVPLKAAPAVVGQAILEELDQPTDRQRLTLPSWDACSSAHLELYGSLT